MAVTDDDVEVLDTDAEGTDAFATYFAEANKACDREVGDEDYFAAAFEGYLPRNLRILEIDTYISAFFVDVFPCACPSMADKTLRIRDRQTKPTYILRTYSVGEGGDTHVPASLGEDTSFLVRFPIGIASIFAAETIPTIAVSTETTQQFLSDKNRSTFLRLALLSILTYSLYDSHFFLAYGLLQCCSLQVVFDAELGLAVESLPGGASTHSLWKLV